MEEAKVLKFLKLHRKAFFEAAEFADETAHPTPADTRSWSQILVSLITEIKGLSRGKGSDLADGSDVKGACTWGAIDTPRFNGVIKAGTKSKVAGKIEYLDSLPHLFFVLWDNEPENQKERCRIWVVRPSLDELFKEMCEKWYALVISGHIKSANFQLHPPRGRNSDIFTNNCGVFAYPLLFSAVWNDNDYEVKHFEIEVLENGNCRTIT